MTERDPANTGGFPPDVQLKLILNKLEASDKLAAERDENMCQRFKRVEKSVDGLTAGHRDLQREFSKLGARQSTAHAAMLGEVHEVDQRCEERDRELEERLRAVEQPPPARRDPLVRDKRGVLRTLKRLLAALALLAGGAGAAHLQHMLGSDPEKSAIAAPDTASHATEHAHRKE